MNHQRNQRTRTMKSHDRHTHEPSRRTCAFESLEDRRLCAAGDPDLSFSGDGRTTVDFLGGLRAHAADAAVQRDGKTVVVGFLDAGCGNRQFAVARLNLHGTPDNSLDRKSTRLNSSHSQITSAL